MADGWLKDGWLSNDQLAGFRVMLNQSYYAVQQNGIKRNTLLLTTFKIERAFRNNVGMFHKHAYPPPTKTYPIPIAIYLPTPITLLIEFRDQFLKCIVDLVHAGTS